MEWFSSCGKQLVHGTFFSTFQQVCRIDRFQVFVQNIIWNKKVDRQIYNQTLIEWSIFVLNDIRDFIFLWKMCGLCFFHMISHILSRRIKIDKLVFASSLELNFCKRGEKNLAQTNFSDQRRWQDDICHSILNKISFICIMAYRHNVWYKKNNTFIIKDRRSLVVQILYKLFGICALLERDL